MAKKAPKKVSNDVYKATVKIFGRVSTAEGATAIEAINNLNVGVAKGRSILTIEHGDKKKERVLMPGLTFRLFNSAGMTKEIVLKNMGILFDL